MNEYGGDVTTGIPWGNPDSNILDDISEMVKMVRLDSGISPPNVYLFNVKTLAYIMLGSFVENIEAGIAATLTYQPPKSTITDHLRDCFGFLTC